MIIRHHPTLHLTYCLNVHPGETWEENFAAIRENSLRVRDAVSPPALFGLGMRLSNVAAATLADSERLAEFREFCDVNRLYVFTINGFPYGRFHERSVKAEVYRPDWRQPERRDYTNTLTDILAALLPEGLNGSISTVPGSYKAWIRSVRDMQAVVENLAASAAHADETLKSTGRMIEIALEPEPDCLLGSVDQTIDFFHDALPRFGVPYLRRTRGINTADAEALIARHLGVCYDTAHMAVEFEDLAGGLEKLRDAAVRVSKIHLSAALSVSAGADTAAILREFSEPVYLHQTRRQTADGSIHAFTDLPQALDTPAEAADRWRTHFHVPLFFERNGGLVSTRELLTPEFFRLLNAGVSRHLEIETYTYHVLPDTVAVHDIAAGIAREYAWVLQRLDAFN